ncbi:MAG: hypothetical protein Fur0043_19880 [Anaerolineales bacterium]
MYHTFHITPYILRITHDVPRPMRHASRLLALLLLALGLSACLKPTQQVDTPTLPSPPGETATPPPPPGQQEVTLLSVEENGYAHLFMYSPQGMLLTRLTYGAWDDITPALSPDQTQIAFASNRSGVWDLYVMELASGQVRRVTDTPEYEAAPSWSPDGRWLACERYVNENLEIAVLSLTDPAQEVINLSDHPASDYAPAWSPDGRRIAFVSNRGGDSDIWLADLDKAGSDRYTNLSRTPFAAENHPVWARDGAQLAWASAAQTIGLSGIYVWNSLQPERPAAWVGNGDWPAWDAPGDHLTVIILAPNLDYLTAYTLKGDLLLQPLPLPGPVRGLAWGKVTLPNLLPGVYEQAAVQTSPALWTAVVTPLAEGPSQRYAINTLPEVQAPYPQLHDLADEAFMALRERTIKETGWDALAALSNAFVPLTTLLDPGLGEDWLYTGRAFALNPLMVNAGWMVAVRQDYGAQTYWKLYLRTQLQDGTQGEPLHEPPWDLAARNELEPKYYEQGGKYAAVPPGYWIDFTNLARQYGWERVQALPNWRTFYSGARFTEFALTGGLDWYSAMLEIYPKDVLVTPTHILPPSPTPTKTPIPTRTKTPTRTPRPTSTPTLSPTPKPTQTKTAPPPPPATATNTLPPPPTATHTPLPPSPTPTPAILVPLITP